MLDNRETEILVMKSPWSFGVDVLIRNGNSILSDVVFKEHNDEIVAIPNFNLNANNAQKLMDDLWIAGFRPSEGTGSAGALKATERHLADMRKIVFDNMKSNGNDI